MKKKFYLDFVIVTFKRTKFIFDTINSFIDVSNKYKNSNFRLVILDGSDDNFKEEINSELISTREMIDKYFKKESIFYKQYANNGHYAKILSDYVYNHSDCSSYFSFVGDDDIFIDLSGFDKAVKFLQNNPQFSLCNITRQDDIVGENKYTFDEMEGYQYVKNFINLNLIDTESVTHVFNLDLVKKFKTLKFLYLREVGLEDFYGFDMYFLFNTALSGKVKYFKTNNAVKTAQQGNEVRYTVMYPLTQWICYYIYSKYTIDVLTNDKINFFEKRKFMLHWLNSFIICFNKYCFSKYDTREIDYLKVKKYCNMPVFIFFLRETFKILGFNLKIFRNLFQLSYKYLFFK